MFIGIKSLFTNSAKVHSGIETLNSFNIVFDQIQVQVGCLDSSVFPEPLSCSLDKQH